MRKLTLKKITIAVLMATLPVVAQSAGLGRLNVLSSLGEPFRAEIDLVSATPEELETLTAVIASNEAYSAQGITRLGIHNDISVSLAKNGKPKVILSSNKTVSDPYLDMLIQLDWASGRLQREYTVLLDPPEYQQPPIASPTPAVALLPMPAPAPLPMPTVTASDPMANMQVIKPDASLPPLAQTVEPARKATNQIVNNNFAQLPSVRPTVTPGAARIIPTSPPSQMVQRAPVVSNDRFRQSVQSTTVGAKSEAEIQAEIERIELQAKSAYSSDWSAPSASTDAAVYERAPVIADDRSYTAPSAPSKVDSHRTRRGDNLSKIAKSMSLSGVSLNQMLVGLYEYNKDAFVNGNMNRLKVGKVISLPSKVQLLSVSRSEANQTFAVHTQNWQSYRQAVAGNASESVSVADSKLSESGEITAFEPEQPIEAKKTQDVVKLSPSDNKEAEQSTDQSVMDAKKEDDIAKDKAVKEAEDRTAAVEKQIEDMQKLLKMKNDEMAVLEQKAVADNEDAVVAEIEPKPESSMVDLTSAPPVSAKPEPMPTSEVKADPIKPAAPVQPPPAEPTLWEKVQEFITMPILGGLGAALLLLLGLLFFRNKRKKDLENFERGILTSGGLRANTVFGNTTGDTSATDTSFLTDFAQTTDGAVMDSNEVDPIAEAEVYMAYGREAQAEEILKEAIKKEPSRHELQLKLLEIYQERKDKAAFETLASELYTTLGDDDPTWKKVAAMGLTLEPDNPLYSADDEPSIDTSVSDEIENTAASSVDANVIEVGLNKAADTTSSAAAEVGDIASTASAKAMDAAGGVADGAGDAAKSVASKAAGIAGLATGAVAGAAAATGSRIESIVRHEPTPKPDAELTLDAPDLDVSEPELEVESFTLDTDIADIEVETQSAVEEVVDAEPQDFDLSGISLEIEEDTTESIETIENIESALEVPEIELDAPAPSTEEILSSADEDTLDDNEVEIKLNLVTAYIDMDDKEGARELIEEVIKEGSEDQVMRAQMIKDSMS